MNSATRRALGATLVLTTALLLPGAAPGHELDHPAPGFSPGGPPSSNVNSGGQGAEWQLIKTITTGNPQTDLDFFTQGGETFASVGTLATGGNGGGQTIIQLTKGGKIDPGFVAAHPSATCVSNPAAALGLQHDVEATPKGSAILNTPNPAAVRSDTQLLIDATDAAGRCHDQGTFGLSGAPQGGLEIIDVTNLADPVEIGMTSHIGQSHTVNVDPKRPHIAYSVTSDAIGVNAEGQRQNEFPQNSPTSTDRFDLDGFEVVDLSSCMNFPAGTSVEAKRAACVPQVYRYRYPSAEIALGHTLKTGAQAIFGCHELEIYPDDRLTCGSGNALMAFQMSGAFDDMGTPSDFSDDKPRGTPLPCKTRMSSSTPPFKSGATVIDCIDGTLDESVGGVSASQDLTIPGWIAQGSPSLEGVEFLGSIHHQGRGAGSSPATPAFPSTEDIDFNHEAELSGSGELLLATDERGGGVLPPGASCSPGADNTAGNGGVHFYDVDGLHQGPPGTPQEEFKAYARTPEGKKAIYRAPIRTKAQGTVCTAHVMQQVPGENRIFMAWYSQGTQVIDFVENPDGTVRFQQAGFFIPENANQWVSHVFKSEDNPDGTTTYFGVAGDFNLGESGRNSIDVYKVTLPPAPRAVDDAGQPGGGACAQKVVGTKGKDRLIGSIAGDRINGRKGNDRVKGRAGDDCLKGGGANDRVNGGEHDDTANGGGGKDRVKGGEGNDLLKGGRGKDRLIGGPGKDRIVSGKDPTRR